MRGLLNPAIAASFVLGGQLGIAPHTGSPAVFLPPAYQQISSGNYCGASKDMVVQALELIRPASPIRDLQRANEHLKRAFDLCASSTDALYYRSLVEDRLGNKAAAAYAKEQAQMLGSEAARLRYDPFTLSTPPASAQRTSRGLDAGTAASSSDTPKSTTPHKWALLIGLSKFSDPEIDGLTYTLKDASDLADVLKDPKIGAFDPQYVHLLTNADATTENIKVQLNAIAREAQPQDLVLIYVATHGSPRALDSVQGVNYLVTYNTQVYKSGKVDEDRLYATAFPMVELANAVATRMKALRTVIILDTCYSGGASASGGPSVAHLKDSVPSAEMYSHLGLGTGRIIISASSTEEESYESPELNHGYFTYSLLQALKSSKRGTPLNQIFDSVYAKVTQLASASGVKQHPTIYKSSNDTNFSLDAPVGDATAKASPGSFSSRPANSSSARLAP